MADQEFSHSFESENDGSERRSDATYGGSDFPDFSGVRRVSRNLTTRAAGFASKSRMYVHDDITWELFEQKFREAFNRDMTPDEHRWFHAVWNASSKKKENSAAAAA